MTPTLIWRACVAAAALVVAATAAAQQAAAPPGARVVTGIVTDTAGVPVDSADVSISSLKQRTIAGSDGTFRFTGVKPGRYSVSARRIGLRPRCARSSWDPMAAPFGFHSSRRCACLRRS